MMIQGMNIASPVAPRRGGGGGGSYADALTDLAGRFEVQRVLQKAIYGTVLLVSPSGKPEELIVMKAVSKDLSSRSVCRDGTQVFEDHNVELQVLGVSRDLPHPNLLSLSPEKHQMESALTRYTALPYLAGGELFEAIEAGGAMHEEAARDLVCGIALGLDHLHRTLGFVHNDVSLENVLLSPDGRPVVCDFGLASVVGTKWDSRRCISGKLPYQAPEIYFGTARTSEGTGDVFSLGVTLFVILTGIPAFDLPDPIADQRYNYIQMGRMGELLDLWGKSLPAQVVDLLTRMLAHEPSRRLTMQEVLAHPWLAPAAAKMGALLASPMATEGQAPTIIDCDGEEEALDDNFDFVFDMDMVTDAGVAACDKQTGCRSNPATPIASKVRFDGAAGFATNHTASPDSVFSFEKAYRKHVSSIGASMRR